MDTYVLGTESTPGTGSAGYVSTPGTDSSTRSNATAGTFDHRIERVLCCFLDSVNLNCLFLSCYCLCLRRASHPQRNLLEGGALYEICISACDGKTPYNLRSSGVEKAKITPSPFFTSIILISSEGGSLVVSRGYCFINGTPLPMPPIPLLTVLQLTLPLLMGKPLHAECYFNCFNRCCFF